MYCVADLYVLELQLCACVPSPVLPIRDSGHNSHLLVDHPTTVNTRIHEYTKGDHPRLVLPEQHHFQRELRVSHPDDLG